MLWIKILLLDFKASNLKTKLNSEVHGISFEFFLNNPKFLHFQTIPFLYFLHYFSLSFNCSKTIGKTNPTCVTTINLLNRNSVKTLKLHVLAYAKFWK